MPSGGNIGNHLLFTECRKRKKQLEFTLALLLFFKIKYLIKVHNWKKEVTQTLAAFAVLSGQYFEINFTVCE